MSPQPEISDSFDCFGSTCTVLVIGTDGERAARDAVSDARERLHDWHGRFSRFLPGSELSRLNRDPRATVPVSPLMARFAGAARSAGSLSRGLVDATLLRQIEDAGYRADLPDSLPLAAALRFAPPRRPARPAGRAAWRRLEVDIEGATVTRPPGIALDSGGVAKGLLADVLAEQLAGHDAFAINCAGDLAIGGRAAMTRQVQVESPFDGRTVHAFELQRGAVATSGIGRRSWLGADGRPAHHLLDPATGRPAFTGIVQATALAPSALEAEVRAKAALLSGPLRAAGWLAGGGVLVFDDGSHTVIQPPPVVTLSELSSFARRRADAVPEAA